MAEVVIYTRQFCGYCSAAKRLLDSKGASYVEHDGTYDPAIRAEMVERSNGGRTFPQIFIDGRHIGGSDDLHALDRAGGLDPLLAAEARAK
jgi:glutaredoxin 3